MQETPPQKRWLRQLHAFSTPPPTDTGKQRHCCGQRQKKKKRKSLCCHRDIQTRRFHSCDQGKLEWNPATGTKSAPNPANQGCDQRCDLRKKWKQTVWMTAEKKHVRFWTLSSCGIVQCLSQTRKCPRGRGHQKGCHQWCDFRKKREETVGWWPEMQTNEI